MMKAKRREVHRMVEEQAKRWLYERVRAQGATVAPAPYRPVITLSRQRGSGGSTIAGKVAESMGFPLFHSEIVTELARRMGVDPSIVEAADERMHSRIRDWAQSLFDSRYATHEEYLEHLVALVTTIGELGGAVIVGRGAGFILRRDRCFRVRIVAPLEERIARVARTHGLDQPKATELVQWTDRERRAFIRESFRADDCDAANYDLVLNTGRFELDAAVRLIVQVYRELFDTAR